MKWATTSTSWRCRYQSHPAGPVPGHPVSQQLRCSDCALPSAQLSRHNKQLQHLLKPVKRIQEEEAEGISSMVGVRTGLGVGVGLRSRGGAGRRVGGQLWGWEAGI